MDKFHIYNSVWCHDILYFVFFFENNQPKYHTFKQLQIKKYIKKKQH